MEPLAITLRQNNDIKGLKVGSDHHKLALYAEDLLLYISSLSMTLQIILKEFGKFGALSNFKVNTHT